MPPAPEGPARFFCENCGEEVRRDSRQCPRCGRYFARVRCPRCGFTGGESDFQSGCPVCAYCFTGGESSGPPLRPGNGRRYRPAGGLPRWVYALAAAALAAVGAALWRVLSA
ncbi:MAG: zinc-ribbon domain-containing protein [Treponema sp.]|jgi:predicted RNA-binding Zn-ribbon protein involved in translation (DUF1610 family)|nr:zinc-ribbon domain-containing protein [Treponema sp.]